ncbi:MAG: alpha/beta hydrolase [Bacteroidales bacterium]|nr:alpha/beta hydrolase [Bacteroidales bacterium]
MKKHFISVIISLQFLFVACNNNLKPNYIDEDGVRIYNDINYGTSDAQKLDIAFPLEPQSTVGYGSCILFIHGGGWSSGDKSSYDGAIRNASKISSLVSATMNYRMFGDNADCQDMLDDIYAAISKIKDFASEENIQLKKIILMGASAGGHLSLLYSYKYYSSSPIPVVLCVSQCGPTDFLDESYLSMHSSSYIQSCLSYLLGFEITIDDIYSYENEIKSISPAYYVKQNIPPTLLAYGSLDDIVPITNATILYEMLIENEIDSQLFIYENSGHGLDNDSETDKQFFDTLFNYVIKYCL